MQKWDEMLVFPDTPTPYTLISKFLQTSRHSQAILSVSLLYSLRHSRGKKMKRLLSITAGSLLLGSSLSAIADGMSCYVDTRGYDQFTPDYCFAVVGGARRATAVFRIDDLPNHYTIIWNQPNCAANQTICSTTIQAFHPYTASAYVLNLDENSFTTVSATAEFEDGS